jgi:hypothetical protein
MTGTACRCSKPVREITNHKSQITNHKSQIIILECLDWISGPIAVKKQNEGASCDRRYIYLEQILVLSAAIGPDTNAVSCNPEIRT